MVGSRNLSAVYLYEKSMNLNEIMFRVSHHGQQISKDNLLSYLVHSAIIGKELEKYRVEMLEMDPKNLYQNENLEIKIGSCFKFVPGNTKISEIPYLSTENVMYAIFYSEPRSCLRRSIPSEPMFGGLVMWHILFQV